MNRQKHTYYVTTKDRSSRTWMLATIRFKPRSVACAVTIDLVMQSGSENRDAFDRCQERLHQLVRLMAQRRQRRLGLGVVEMV